MVPLLFDLVEGARPVPTTAAHARSVRLPKVTGEQLFAIYRDHNGPGNIPADRTWRLHTELSDSEFDVEAMVRERREREVTRKQFASACYPEHGLPMLLFLAVRHEFDPEKALIANANAGGDNVHRGMLLGMLVGAAAEKMPESLVRGLADHTALQEEIGAYADLASTGDGF